MKVLARAKMPKTSQRDFLVAHRYKIACNDCLSCINADRNVRLF